MRRRKEFGKCFHMKIAGSIASAFLCYFNPVYKGEGECVAPCVLTFQFQFKYLDEETKEMSIDKGIKRSFKRTEGSRG